MGRKVRPARKADNLTAICELSVDNVGPSTSHNPMGLYGLLQEYLNDDKLSSLEQIFCEL
jgi:hypothetical protein